MATSKRKRGESDERTNDTPAATQESTTRSRNNRAGGKTTGDESTTQRRGRNEPGRYPEASSSKKMETAFDDEDIADNDLIDDHADEGDGDVDWDDTPARGGGRRPDE